MSQDDHTLFRIVIGQIWKKEGKYYHIPPQHEELDPHHWRVIPIAKNEFGLWRWIGPISPLIWKLEDFQTATVHRERDEAEV